MLSNFKTMIYRIFSIWKESFCIWLYTPPNEDDFFFVNFRTHFQKLFSCKHKRWIKTREFHRKCACCGEYQIMAYHRYGNIRTEWISYNIDPRNPFP